VGGRILIPQAILFDAGGTLVLQDAGAMSAVLGHPIDVLAAHRAHYEVMAEFSDLLTAGRHESWDWWLARYFLALEVPDSETAGARLNRGYGLWTFAIAGALEAVARLQKRGIRLGVVSNSDGSVGKSLIEAGFGGLFEVVIDSTEVGVGKPDPAIFQLALDRIEVRAEATWYVGDSLYHDVQGAERAGLGRAILVDPYRLSVYPDRIASTADLPDLIGL
jgi:putative hydrolase of the HAD superfamily